MTITTHAESATRDLRLALLAERQGTNDRAVDSLLLDVELWTSSHGSQRVEILLGCGGPTRWVAVDLDRERVTFHHSWVEPQSVELCDSLARHWVALAERIAS